MYKGPQHEDKSLFNTMEFEHTADKDAAVSFSSPNGLSTRLLSPHSSHLMQCFRSLPHASPQRTTDPCTVHKLSSSLRVTSCV